MNRNADLQKDSENIMDRTREHRRNFKEKVNEIRLLLTSGRDMEFLGKLMNKNAFKIKYYQGILRQVKQESKA